MKHPHLANSRSIIVTLLSLLGLFVLPLILFAPVALGPRTLLPADNLFTFEPYLSAATELGVGQPHNHLLNDLILENYAWKRFIVQSIQAGQLPLWNPYLFAGSPFLATGQHSVLYPLSAVFYILPLWRAFGLFTVIQLGLAGVSMYAFMRVLRVSRLGALVAGMTYQMSGFFVVSAVHPMIIAAAAWLPLTLASIELILQQRSFLRRPATIPWTVVGALSLGASALTGHAEVLYFSLLVSAFFTIWRLIFELFNTQLDDASGVQRVGVRAMWISVMVILGLGLGAIQLVPMAELVTHSFREGRASLSQILGWAYPIRRLLTFLTPNFFGNPAHHSYLDVFSGQVIQSEQPIDWGIKNYVEGGAYLGILPLFLAALAVLNTVPQRSSTGGIPEEIRASPARDLSPSLYPAVSGSCPILPGLHFRNAPLCACLRASVPQPIALTFPMGFSADSRCGCIGRFWHRRHSTEPP